MQIRKILPCLDIKDGAVIVGQQFQNLKTVADPLSLARRYDQAGADELVIYDIAASLEGRKIFDTLISEIKENTSLPLTIGGGIQTLEDIERVLELGATKVSINSGAIQNPQLLSQGVKAFGSQPIVLSIDIKKVGDTYHVFSAGGQRDTGMDALQWAKQAEEAGVGELVLNSIATDGAQGGFDISLLRDIAAAVSLPLVASGGAGSEEDFLQVFRSVPSVRSALGASVFHFELLEIKTLKEYLKSHGIPVQ